MKTCILRGASWDYEVKYCHVDRRFFSRIEKQDVVFSFRVIKRRTP